MGEMVRAVLATELARARARRAGSEADRNAALREAGDAYEKAGRTRSGIESKGRSPEPWLLLARGVGRGLGWLIAWDADRCRRLERRLL